MLVERDIKTKRGNNWNKDSVCRILTNETYLGKFINGKEEIADFLTGQRKEKDESEWLVTIRPKLHIIEDKVLTNHSTFERSVMILSRLLMKAKAINIFSLH